MHGIQVTCVPGSWRGPLQLLHGTLVSQAQVTLQTVLWYTLIPGNSLTSSLTHLLNLSSPPGDSALQHVQKIGVLDQVAKVCYLRTCAFVGTFLDGLETQVKAYVTFQSWSKTQPFSYLIKSNSIDMCFWLHLYPIKN